MIRDIYYLPRKMKSRSIHLLCELPIICLLKWMCCKYFELLEMILLGATHTLIYLFVYWLFWVFVAAVAFL